MKLYLSEFAVSDTIARDARYDLAIEAVLTFCVGSGVACQRSDDFADYAEIERRIDEADVVLALIDRFWTSSTWKWHELAYAAGGPSIVAARRGKKNPHRMAMLVDSADLPAGLARDTAPLLVIRTMAELHVALAGAFSG